MWYYKNKEVLIIPEKSTHFVYKITNIDNKMIYIGYKGFYSKTTKKLGKKALLALPDKRMSKKVVTVAESNWKLYNSSNKVLAALVNKMPNKFKKEIIYFCNTEKKARFLEAKLQFCEEVLEIQSYNDNILGKFFRKDL